MKAWQKGLIAGLVVLVVVLLGLLLLSGSPSSTSSRQEISIETQMK